MRNSLIFGVIKNSLKISQVYFGSLRNSTIFVI